MPSRTQCDARLLVNALLDHVAGPERARAIEQLGGLQGAVDARRLAAAMRAARLDEAEARRVGVAAAAAVMPMARWCYAESPARLLGAKRTGCC